MQVGAPKFISQPEWKKLLKELSSRLSEGVPGSASQKSLAPDATASDQVHPTSAE